MTSKKCSVPIFTSCAENSTDRLFCCKLFHFLVGISLACRTAYSYSRVSIIYALTIRDAEQVTRWPQELEVQSYTSASENKEELEQALLENQVKALRHYCAKHGFRQARSGFCNPLSNARISCTLLSASDEQAAR